MIDKDFMKETFEKFVECYGEENEYRMCIEEMSELTKALCKYMRATRAYPSDENRIKLEQVKEDVIEETADLMLCLLQIKRLFGDEAVENIMEYKLKRGRAAVDKDLADKK